MLDNPNNKRYEKRFQGQENGSRELDKRFSL